MSELQDLLDTTTKLRGVILDLMVIREENIALRREIERLRVAWATEREGASYMAGTVIEQKHELARLRATSPEPAPASPASPSGGPGAAPPGSLEEELPAECPCWEAGCASYRGEESVEPCGWGHKNLIGAACPDYVDRNHYLLRRDVGGKWCPAK